MSANVEASHQLTHNFPTGRYRLAASWRLQVTPTATKGSEFYALRLDLPAKAMVGVSQHLDTVRLILERVGHTFGLFTALVARAPRASLLWDGRIGGWDRHW